MNDENIKQTEGLTDAYEQPAFSNGPSPYAQTEDAPAGSAPHRSKESKFEHWTIAALSPFIFLALGFFFGWWSWAWLIIPVTGILSSPIEHNLKIVALSPFLYIFLGFFLGWWAWGWIIIPISGILFAGMKRNH